MLLAPWVTDADLPADRPALPDDGWAAWCEAASSILYALSGRRWGGVGTTTVAARAAGALTGWSPAGPLLDGSTEPPYVDVVSGSCTVGWGGPHDGCGGAELLRLPDWPVREVVSVTDRFGVVSPTSYRVEDARDLIRVVGSWDTCQGVVVSYRFGTRPPVAGRLAAAALALELGRSVVDPDKCALPRGTTSITRQGITKTFESLGTIVDAGRTGLPAVDLWLRAVNPGRQRRRASVWTPELDRARREPGTTVPVPEEPAP